MALTPAETLALQRQHGIVLLLEDDGWHAKTRELTRLHRGGRLTQEEAIEAAVSTINESTVRSQEADGQRIFSLLASGRYFARPRQIEVEGGQAIVWDTRRSATNAIIVQGERSLRAAIIETERILNSGV